MDEHRQDAGISLFSASLFPRRWRGVGDVGDGRALKNFCGGVAHGKKHAIKGPVLSVAVDQASQLIGITERRKRAVDQADDFTQADVRRLTPQLVSPFGAADAFDDAGVLELEQNQFEKLFRQLFLIRDVADTIAPWL